MAARMICQSAHGSSSSSITSQVFLPHAWEAGPTNAPSRHCDGSRKGLFRAQQYVGLAKISVCRLAVKVTGFDPLTGPLSRTCKCLYTAKPQVPSRLSLARFDCFSSTSPCLEVTSPTREGGGRSVRTAAGNHGAEDFSVGTPITGETEIAPGVGSFTVSSQASEGAPRPFQRDLHLWITTLGRIILPVVILGLGIFSMTQPSHALANALKPTAARKQILVSAWTGLVAGCLHTLTGPDHLAALAPLCIGRSKLESAEVGALWGCGHDAGQLIFGIVFLVLKDRLHLDLIRTWASRVVGLTLITIGGIGVMEAQEVSNLAFEGGHTSVDDGGIGVAKRPRSLATFATGVVHGLQPDALLMILPALAIPSRLAGAAFLGMFLGGTIIAMGSYTLFIASCSEALQKKVPGITKRLSLGSALIAIALGSAFILGEFFGVSLFGS